jgi:uncharacterized membrane protein YccF (DUF307 family)
MRLLLNLLWFLFGGFVMGLGWWLAGVVAAITIVGIPWARACFLIGKFSFWPFGQEAVNRRELTGMSDFGTGPFGFLGNLIWFLVAGWWLAIGHVSSALACFVTIIGIPFGIQHLKLAVIALAPIGMEVVPRERLQG